MERKIILLVSLLVAIPISILGSSAKIHNLTNYDFHIDEWRTRGVCKTIRDITIPKNSEVLRTWGGCPFDSAEFQVTIANRKSIALKTDTMTAGTRDWYIHADAPEGTKFVRFFLWVTPYSPSTGGLYAVSDWYDKTTGLADNEGAKKAGLTH